MEIGVPLLAADSWLYSLSWRSMLIAAHSASSTPEGNSAMMASPIYLSMKPLYSRMIGSMRHR